MARLVVARHVVGHRSGCRCSSNSAAAHEPAVESRAAEAPNGATSRREDRARARERCSIILAVVVITCRELPGTSVRHCHVLFALERGQRLTDRRLSMNRKARASVITTAATTNTSTERQHDDENPRPERAVVRYRQAAAAVSFTDEASSFSYTPNFMPGVHFYTFLASKDSTTAKPPTSSPFAQPQDYERLNTDEPSASQPQKSRPRSAGPGNSGP